ncbi:transcriptional regulator, TetR family [Lentzea xinjiangensis]|uniref:Transcriptional regulator, TetR family n=1 Tax=Lentzea xinjiangensis TaxID=402600 RepID=A0A1H9K0T5_9PSEU|nr:TetR/AcrR family transcriptional regulator [Lentzea xinjiangensis]SEQ92846.1 transcriptional regulator, TetR family [Lentzea xinjiangensis]
MTGQGNTAVGRPRSFDTDEALHQAMLVFWKQGYEGASLTDLTGAMGITKTSMYAAFGNKEQLFRKALERYTDGPAAYGLRALEEPTARAVAAAFLNGSVRTTTQPDCPAGCLGVQGALAAGEAGTPAHEVLAEWRNVAGRRLEERFRRAAEEGDLPPGASARRLALYVMTVAFGIAVQAAGGIGRADLQEVADAAMDAWPA